MRAGAWSCAWWAVGVAGVLSAAGAQVPATDAGQAAREQFEPRSGPGPGQAFLARMAGEWAVEKTFYPREGKPNQASGTCRQAMVHGGLFLESAFRFGDEEGTGLIGFEPATGRFTSVWTSSRSTRMSIRHSPEPFDGSRIELLSQTPGAGTAGAEARRSRTVTTLEEDGSRIVHRQFAIEPGGGERLVMELRMSRLGTGVRPDQ